MTNWFSKLFKRKNKKSKVDLSAASDTGLALILLRMPVEDLIGNCTRVSPQWNRILSESAFWRDKMDHDGYHLEWRKYKLAGISAKSFKWMALNHCFNRNFIYDKWNLDERSLTFDFGWEDGNEPQPLAPTAENIRIEIPPVFVDGEPEIPEGFEKPIPACIGIHNQSFTKKMVIKLEDEGLTNEIMDKFRPTIVITEMVANRRDCYSVYHMCCCLEADYFDADAYHNHRAGTAHADEHWVHRYRREQKDEDGRWIGVAMGIRFNEGDAEGWHQMKHVFNDYPSGMRYLVLDCGAFGTGFNPPDVCGLKLANFSVKALFEKNAPE